MKIKQIKVHILKKELSTSMQISRGGFKTRRHCIIEVQTDSGLSGLGEGIGNPDAIQALVEKCMAPLLTGANALEIDSIRNKLMTDSVYFERGGSWTCAVSAIEMALWDIKGKHLNCPVYELLGGRSQDTLELYASDVYWYEDTKLVARDIESILEKGIKNVKIHTGVKSPKEEHARFKDIQSIFEPIQKLMIDLNCAYSLPDAILAVKYFDEFNPYWIEEPLAIGNEDQLARVRSVSRTPISYGENILNVEGFKRIFADGGMDVAMPDVGRVGGISACLEVQALAKTYGVQTSYHNFSSGVLLAATMHMMCARSEKSILEYDSSTNSVIHEFFHEGLKIKDGRMQVPTAPGLGVTLTDAVLKYKA